MPPSCQDLDNVGLEERNKRHKTGELFFPTHLESWNCSGRHLSSCFGHGPFLRHQELCFPEKKPLGAELERQAAFSRFRAGFKQRSKPLFVSGFRFVLTSRLMQPNRLWAAPPHILYQYRKDVNDRAGGLTLPRGQGVAGRLRLAPSSNG